MALQYEDLLLSKFPGEQGSCRQEVRTQIPSTLYSQPPPVIQMDNANTCLGQQDGLQIIHGSLTLPRGKVETVQMSRPPGLTK